MIEISKELSKHWNILLTEEDIADAYKNSNRHESDCFVLATIYNTELQLNISNLQLIDGVLYADINEVEGLPMNIVKVDVEGGHLIAYYREGVGEMSRIDLGSVVGPKGDTGAMPNISVGEVVTSAPGSNANVSITGTEEDPVLNFTIPRGAIGEVSEAELSKKLNEKADVISGTVSGDIVTFDGNGGDLFSCVANIEPIQSGTGDPSPTNIRPISGRTGLTVTRCGKNLLNNTARSGTKADVTFTVNADGTVSTSGTATSGTYLTLAGGFPSYRVPIPDWMKLGEQYTISSGIDNPSTNQNVQIAIYDADGNNVVPAAHDTTFTVPANAAYYGVFIRVLDGTNVSGLTFKPMIRAAGTSDTFEPYTGQTYPITWESIAGTVYGGTLDVVSGVLTVDHILLSVPHWSKSTLPSGGTRFYSSSYRQTIKPPVANAIVADVICSCFITTDANRGYGGIDEDSITVDTAGMISCYPNRNSTIAALSGDDFKTYMNSQQIIAALKEPQTYNITPTEVWTILGVNNIYTDGGAIIAEYPIDTEKYIDNSITNVKRLIAGIETDYIATKNYAVGDFLVVKNEFLKVVSAIANGEGIVVGQNVSATTVAEQLILLFNS